MATKKEIVLQVLFDAEALMGICEKGKGVQITSTLVDGKDDAGNPVGIMQVEAKSVKNPPKSKAATKVLSAPGGGNTIQGCPVPPCDPQT